jgi:2',3'-cyclic-nucleotide 2'-phosphodiesterase (5'-nucleotidase family)
MRSSLLLLALAAVPSALPAQDTAHVVVVATTDVHGHLEAWDYVQDRSAPWGLVRVATVVDSLRAAYPGAVVLLDAGGFLEGTALATYFATVRPRLGNPIVDAMNAMGYDAVTPGNDEFDFGLTTLDRVVSQAAFPFVSANIVREPSDTFAFAPSVVFARGGIRVGVTGFTTPGTMVWNGTELGGKLRIRPLRVTGSAAVGRVRAAGADFVIAIAHSGLSGQSSYDTTRVGPENDAAALAVGPQRPDLVIVGHSMERIRDSVINGVHFVQPQAWARSVSVVHAWLVRDGNTARVVRMQTTEVPLGSVAPNVVVRGLLRDAHAEVRTWAGAPLATAEGDWSAREARVRDTPLIDFVNAVQRHHASADLSATAVFTATAVLGPGPVRVRDVFGLYPYSYTLRAVRIDGDRLRQYLERSAEYFRGWVPGTSLLDPAASGEDFDIVSGVSYVIDLARPVGSRIRDLTFQGRPVVPTDTFTLALNSRRQTGAGGYTVLQGLPVVYDRGESVRTLLEEAIRGAGTLRAQDVFEPSWRLVPRAAEEAALAMFAPPPPPRDTTLFRVVVTGALRGHVEPGTIAGRAVGGLAAAAAWADSVAASCRCPTFRIDAGGAMFGTALVDASRGAVVTSALTAYRLDAAVPGAADADALGDALAARVREVPFPWTAANVSAADSSAPAFRPWTLLQRDGRSLAVVGVMDGVAPGAPDRRAGPLVIHDPVARSAGAIAAARAARADAVVLIGDFDASCDSGCTGEAVAFAEKVDSSAVDAIIGGTVATAVRGTPVVPVLAYGIGVSTLDVVRRSDGRIAVRSRVDTLWHARVTPDTAVAAAIARGSAGVRRELERPVATLRLSLPGTGEGELALGRLIADAYRSAARSEIAMVPSDAFRAGLNGGVLRVGDLYVFMPLPSPLVTISVTGDSLIAALEHAVDGERLTVHVAGITVQVDPRRPAGRRIREVRLIGGKSIDRRARYTVASPASLLDPRRGFSTLAGAPRNAVGVSDRDALIRYVGLLRQPVDAPPDERIVFRR